MLEVDPIVSLWIRCAVALLFVVSLFHKLSSVAVFKQNISDYQILPEHLTAGASMVLLLLETGAIVLLLWPGQHLSTLLAAALLTLYGVAMALNLMRGRNEIDCGCAGPNQGQPISWILVFRNLIIAGVALIVVLPDSERSISVGDFLVSLAAVLVTALLYSAFNQLNANYYRLKKLHQ